MQLYKKVFLKFKMPEKRRWNSTKTESIQHVGQDFWSSPKKVILVASDLMNMGHSEQAIDTIDHYLQNLTDAEKQDPTYPQSRLFFLTQKAKAYLLLKEYALALSYIEEVLRGAPDDEKALTLKVQILTAMGYSGEALKLTNGADSATDGISRSVKIKALIAAEALGDALTAASEALNDFPDNEVFVLQKAEIYRLVGNKQGACETLIPFIQKRTEIPDTHLTLLLECIEDKTGDFFTLLKSQIIEVFGQQKFDRCENATRKYRYTKAS